MQDYYYTKALWTADLMECETPAEYEALAADLRETAEGVIAAMNQMLEETAVMSEVGEWE